MVGLSRHANLVALLGSASEASSERMLVSEYLPNGNLDTLLHPSSAASRAPPRPARSPAAGCSPGPCACTSPSDAPEGELPHSKHLRARVWLHCASCPSYSSTTCLKAPCLPVPPYQHCPFVWAPVLL